MTREEALNEIKSWDFLEGKEIEAIHTLIPELRESEDERIRRKMIKHFKAKTKEKWCNMPVKDIIAWLEKQKDASKAIEAVDRIDKYIDEHLANAHDMKDSNPDKKYYRGLDDALGKMAGILQDVYSEKENKFAPRVLPCPAAWFEDGEEKQKEQKPEWSEEDEDMLNCCISSIEEAKENRYAYKETDGDTSYDREIDWLNSLRPSWKPSEEQMEALKRASTNEYLPAKQFDILVSLYEQLKKLM